MDFLSIIEHKRDKKELSKEEIDFFIREYTKGNIPDYKASALIMAIYINGMTETETSNLTMAMANSGEILDLTDISDIVVDKHSTGGVGDKITIILMPIIASLGIPVAKMSGRGLGFTGGTADKLEAIPGYKVDLSIDEFKQNVKDIGISLITSSLNLAPADKKIYALRDTIGCVSSIPLIASSIMSKKIAGGANKIVINLTYGSGAFMKDIDSAIKLANIIVDLGKTANKEVRCVLTSMDEPIGYAVGNQLEIIESINALKGNMSEDVKEIVYALAEQMIIMSGKAKDENEANVLIRDAIESGIAFEKFKELVIRQGGDASYIDDISKFKQAEFIMPVVAETSGFVTAINTENIGKISSSIGAGRINKDDSIDFQAGIMIEKKLNDRVEKGEFLAFVHTNMKDKVEEAVKGVNEAYVISDSNLKEKDIVLQVIK